MMGLVVPKHILNLPRHTFGPYYASFGFGLVMGTPSAHDELKTCMKRPKVCLGITHLFREKMTQLGQKG